jgi:hypothetical protein
VGGAKRDRRENVVTTTEVEIRRANAALGLLAESTTRLLAERAVPDAESALFDNPRMYALGSYCVYENYYDVLRKVSEVVSPEELGRSAKSVNAPHDFTYLAGVCSIYHIGRVQTILDAGGTPGDPFEEAPEEFVGVLDWWERAARVYRNDGLLLPFQGPRGRGSAGDMAMLPPAEVEQLVQMQQGVAGSDRKALSQMMGQLQLYCFLSHSEGRESIFGHGPYPLGDGRALVVREFKELQNEYCPRVRDGRFGEARTVRPQTPIPYESVAVALVLRGVEVRFDMGGTLHADPEAYRDHIESAAIVAGHGERQEALDVSAAEDIADRAERAYGELFAEVIDWDERQAVEVGCYEFLNFVRTMLRQAGMEEALLPEVERAFERSLDRHIERVMEQSGAAVWGWLADAGSRQVFPPYTGRARSALRAN